MHWVSKYMDLLFELLEKICLDEQNSSFLLKMAKNDPKCQNSEKVKKADP